jgi:flagellar motility protein MotE (MotC chaperone)
MSDEQDKNLNQPGADGDAGGQPGAGTPNDSNGAEEAVDFSKLPPAVKAEIQKANKEAERYRRQLREREEADAKSKEKELAEQGNFKKLWEEAQAEREELKALRERETARLESLAQKNEARIKALPKDAQGKVQSILDKAKLADADAVAELLETLIPSLATVQAPDMDRGNRGDGRGTGGGKAGSEEHRKDIRNRYGINRR